MPMPIGARHGHNPFTTILLNFAEPLTLLACPAYELAHDNFNKNI